MENRDKIMQFQNVNITDYLNKIHKSADNFLIETQKHNLKKYMSELNSELYKSFVNNSDGLLMILNTYDYSYGLLNEFNSNSFKSTYENNTEDALNTLIGKELVKKFDKFDDDLSTYITNKRYLVTDEYFNDKDIYCILTNDVLFIGERIGVKNSKNTENKKYELKHALSKTIVDIKRNEGTLTIKAGAIKFELTNEPESTQIFYDAFVEFSTNADGNAMNKDEMDRDLVKYYVMTEQIDRLNEYVQKFSYGEIKSKMLKIRDMNELQSVLKISKNKNKVFHEYIVENFNNNLMNINKIQELNALITEIFAFLDKYVEKLDEIYKIFEKQKILDEYYKYLNIEAFIERIFNYLEKRVYNKFYQLKITDSNLKLIEKRLVLKNYNFHCLFEELLKRKEGFSMRCLDIGKKEIDALLDKYIV